jgi:hypothetical protein
VTDIIDAFAKALAVDKTRGVIPLGVTVHSMSRVMGWTLQLSSRQKWREDRYHRSQKLEKSFGAQRNRGLSFSNARIACG